MQSGDSVLTIVHMLQGQSLILQVGDAEDFDAIPKNFPKCPNPKSRQEGKCPTTGATEESGNLLHIYFLVFSSFAVVIIHKIF